MNINNSTCNIFNRISLRINLSTILIVMLYIVFLTDVANTIIYKSIAQNGDLTKYSRGILELFLVFILLRNREYMPIIIVSMFSFFNFCGLLLLYLYSQQVGADIITPTEIISTCIIANKLLFVFFLLFVLHLPRRTLTYPRTEKATKNV